MTSHLDPLLLSNLSTRPLVASRIEETSPELLFLPEEGTSTAGKLMGSLRGPGRTQGAARLGKTLTATAMATSRRGHYPDKPMPGLLRRLERQGRGAPGS